MGSTKGAGPQVNKDFLKEVPLCCAFHQMNRVIVQSCIECAIQNMIGMIDSLNIISFYTSDLLMNAMI